MEEKTLICKDGHKMFYHVWPIETKAKAAIHINHGMAEYSARYDEFAKYLNSLGFIVYAQDHRGHGLTGENELLGFFADEDGWDKIVSDAIELSSRIKEENKDIPLFVFGHSMGSFLTRCLISRKGSLYKGAIVMGTASSPGVLGKIGKKIALNSIKKNGSKYIDSNLDKLSFSSYNKKFDKNGSPYQWLSRDKNVVTSYDNDPWCGFICANSFYKDLIDGLFEANNLQKALQIPKKLPILLISGTDDPVGNYSKGIKKVEQLYKKAQLEDLSVKLVANARHELLNELEKETTYKYLGDWLIEKM